MKDLSSTVTNNQRSLSFAPDDIFGKNVNDLPTYMGDTITFYTADYNNFSNNSYVNGTLANEILDG